MRGALPVCLAVAFLLAGLGCSANEPTTRPLTMREKQERAMKDPFSYGSDSDRRSISGGGIGEFDREGFHRDMDAVFNP